MDASNNVVRCANNSFGRNASIAASFRNDILEVFSSSSRVHEEEDDDEALKWAALEKLPTFDRLRKGLLVGSGGAIHEVNVQDLGFSEKKQLLERLVKVVVEDNEKFLLRLKDRVDRVGLELPKIEVRFEHLNVDTEVHVGKRALPSFKNFFIGIFEGIATYLHIIPSRKKHISILDDVSGIVKPGRMTLLLGPPSSGKTTLLLALAGKLDPHLKFSGSVSYNGHNMKEFVSRRSAAYISQNDVHISEMTVRETLEFSARCQGVGNNLLMLEELLRREKAANVMPDPDIDVYMKIAAMGGQDANVVTDYIMKILGLEGCADTLIGDHMLRGISGGQRKRVTTGEMLVGPAKAFFMDEISTGLDSSTTFQVVNSIRQFVHILDGTAIISLLQPEPETYNLFDDIVLVSEGKVVYQGPRENVLEFFESMGFKCPDRKGIADFLQEIISKKDQQQYWADQDKPYRFIAVGEFAESFKSFHIGQKLMSELSIPFDKSRSHPAALATGKYGVGKIELLKACFAREILLMKRNSFVYIFRICRLAFMGFVAMTLFLRTRFHRNVRDAYVIIGALYYSVGTIAFGGIADIAMTMQKLPVFYKQRDFFFYPPWAYGLPLWLVKVPAQAIEAAVYVVISYYVVGYDPNVGRLFKQFLVLFVLNQTMSSTFRVIAVVGRNMVLANTYGFFVLLLFLGMSGYVLARDRVKKWWLWSYWTSPLMYAQNALVVTEFTGHKWGRFVPEANMSLGVMILKSKSYFSSAYWYWIGFGALIGLLLLYNLCFVLALTYLNPLGKPQSILMTDNSPSDENASNVLDAQSDENGSRRIVLPFQQHWITFDEIKYSVDMPQAMKECGATEDRLVLLKGISGAFRPGVLTALMGVSGAGKTTLMDVLAGRKTGGYIEGDIMISGYPKKQETFARISGYCEQNDIHSPYLTVHESLVFSAWLRLPQDVDAQIRKMFVEKVMELVELTPLRRGIVGFPGVSGLSAEQRKRLTIAVELVANPSIIFMDEPTSGLDARAAAIVMRTVRNTVDTGRTVVCTIHQPSIDIFESFDELLLMKRGGQEIYVGPLGRHSRDLINYLEGVEGVPKIQDAYNPATWMLEATSSAQETITGIDFAEIYKNSELYKRNKALIRELSRPRPGSSDLHFPTRYAQPFLTQCKACLWKQHWSYWHNPLYSAIKIVYTFLLSFVVGSMFWDLGSKRNTQKDIFNAMGSMYISVFLLGMQGGSAVQPLVAVERAIFYREKAAGMYSALPFAFGQAVVEIPYIFMQTIIYGTLVYAMIGFEWTAKKFLWYIYFIFFTMLYFAFYGMFDVAVTPNQQVASIISSALYSIWNLFSGFVIPRPKTPVWWRWFHYVCPVSWTLYGLAASQFGDLQDKFELELGLESAEQTVADFVRSNFGFRHEFLGVVMFIVLLFGLAFAISFALSIKAFNFQKR
ncbi:pleiotropic drug resistance protein 1-like [Andrographis paniculata]|uniref:pleiotropic drug resistance protein 1-like n=1 Tax=Andrographis paniculata TaxID=175694 RepID=UPI0021E835D9|nr:pleiotropic drug resistance protein 1-like [Andrographis paniculata]